MLETGNKKKYTHRLSIRHHADGFSLYIYNVLSGELLQREDVEALPASAMFDNLERQLVRPRLSGLDVGEVELVSEQPITLVPLDDFRKGEMLPLYRLNFPSMPYTSADIRCEVLSGLEIVVLYPVPEELEQMLLRHYPQLQLRSAAGEALEHFASMKHKKKNDMLHFYVQVWEHSMAVCSLKGHKLHFACTYPVSNDTDRIYYLLSAWKCLETDAGTPCVLCGASKEMAAEIRRFIATVTEE